MTTSKGDHSMKNILLFTFCLFIIASTNLFSQIDTTKSPLLVITLSDDSEYVGRIESAENKFLNFVTRDNKKIRLRKDQIQEVVNYYDSRLASKEKAALKKVVGDTVNIVEYSDGNLSRMIIFPTARSLRSGQGYVQLNELFFPFAAVGIWNKLTIGGGFSIVPVSLDQIVYFSPKVTTFHTKNFDLAAGVFYVTSLSTIIKKDPGYPNGLGVAYGIGTYGDKDKSISLGLGWSFHGEHFQDKPMLILGGDLKIAKNFKLIVESWSPFNTNYILGMIGFRVVGKHISGDAALIKPLGIKSNGAGLLPWFSLTYNFGVE